MIFIYHFPTLKISGTTVLLRETTDSPFGVIATTPTDPIIAAVAAMCDSQKEDCSVAETPDIQGPPLPGEIVDQQPIISSGRVSLRLPYFVGGFLDLFLR